MKHFLSRYKSNYLKSQKMISYETKLLKEINIFPGIQTITCCTRKSTCYIWHSRSCRETYWYFSQKVMQNTSKGIIQILEKIRYLSHSSSSCLLSHQFSACPQTVLESIINFDEFQPMELLFWLICQQIVFKLKINQYFSEWGSKRQKISCNRFWTTVYHTNASQHHDKVEWEKH